MTTANLRRTSGSFVSFGPDDAGSTDVYASGREPLYGLDRDELIELAALTLAASGATVTELGEALANVGHARITDETNRVPG